MSDPTKPVTMEQIAALAGVSTITVSRALRDSPSVTPATRERIKTLAEAAGYRFNHHARNLRLRRSHMVAVMLEMQPDTDRPMTDAYPLQLLGGITQELTSRGYSVLLSALQSPGQGMAASADGVILLGQGAHGSAVKSVAAMGLPLVVWGADRTECIQRSMRALREYRVRGVRTSIPFFRALLADPDFAAGDVDTGFLSAERMEALTTHERHDEVALVAAAISALERDHAVKRPAPGATGRGQRWKWSLR